MLHRSTKAAFFHHHVYLKALCLGCFVQVLLHALKSEGSENCSWLMAFCSWLASTVTARQQCHPSQQLNQFFQYCPEGLPL